MKKIKSFLNQIVISLGLLTIASAAFAQNLKTFKMGYGHYVAYESQIFDKTKPTLVFLPGVYRALDSRDEIINIVKKNKTNYVTLHFSPQPESIMKVPAFEIAAFKYGLFTAQTLADEVTSLIDELKVTNPIVVGLSYSSVVTTELAKNPRFSLIIETAPMIHFDEANPDGSALLDSWANFYRMYPVVGEYYARNLIRSVYYLNWQKEIDVKYGEGEYSNIRNDAVSGYTELSVIAHGFNFEKQNFEKSVPRYFVLGDQELPARFALQNNTIAQYESVRREMAHVYIVKNAGHVIPSDQPESYFKILKEILKTLEAPQAH